MRIAKKTTKTVTTEEAFSYTCDFCSRSIEEVNKKHYEGEQTTRLDIEIGQNFHWEDGDERERYSVDFCVECFSQKIRPAIEALGPKFRETRDKYWDKILKEHETAPPPVAAPPPPPVVVTEVMLREASPEHAAELVAGPDAYDLFLLIEEDRQLFRLFPRTPRLWDPFKNILQGILQLVGPRYVGELIKPDVVYAACADIQRRVKELGQSGAFPEIRGWLDTFKVTPVKLADPDELSRNPFAPRLVPYDHNVIDRGKPRRMKGPDGY